MQTYQTAFIKFALACGALKFGEFVLKSQRVSPYFFNAGMFRDGAAFHQLGLFYADAINAHFKDQYDVIFGPAYKGLPLATAASIGLHINYGQTSAVSFNRKEAKDHGEGGVIIGTELADRRVLLIDDVITAGTTVRDSLALIQAAPAQLVGIIIALDRQERGLTTALSALEEVRQLHQLKVASIITLENLIEFIRQEPDAVPGAAQHLDNILTYQATYGTQSTSC